MDAASFVKQYKGCELEYIGPNNTSKINLAGASIGVLSDHVGDSTIIFIPHANAIKEWGLTASIVRMHVDKVAPIVSKTLQANINKTKHYKCKLCNSFSNKYGIITLCSNNKCKSRRLTK
jgi:hypothetical protein